MVNVGLKGGLVTFGLGRPACKGIITMAPFQLACFIPTPQPGVSGGVIPLAPGEIGSFYQPVAIDNEGNFVDPRVYGKRHVMIRIKSEFFEGGKEYLVPTTRVKAIVKVVNILNTTISKMKVSISTLKQYAIKATVTIKKLKWKRK